jgi:hypothetical protein
LIIVYSLLIIYYSFLILVDILYLLVYIFSHYIHGYRGLGVEDRNVITVLLLQSLFSMVLGLLQPCR